MASHILQQTMSQNNRIATQHVGEMRVKPKEHPSLLLGTFTPGDEPIGFSVFIHPNPKPAGSVTTRVSRTGTPDKYKLILHVVNSGTKTVGVEAHQLLGNQRDTQDQ